MRQTGSSRGEVVRLSPLPLGEDGRGRVRESLRTGQTRPFPADGESLTLTLSQRETGQVHLHPNPLSAGRGNRYAFTLTLSQGKRVIGGCWR